MLNNLAGVLFALGERAAAVAPPERAVVVSQRSLGPGHPDTAMSISDLGNALRRLGTTRAARERALALEEKTPSPDHPDLAGALAGIGPARYASASSTPPKRPRASYEKLGPRPGVEQASRWLAEHPK